MNHGEQAWANHGIKNDFRLQQCVVERAEHLDRRCREAFASADVVIDFVDSRQELRNKAINRELGCYQLKKDHELVILKPKEDPLFKVELAPVALTKGRARYDGDALTLPWTAKKHCYVFEQTGIVIGKKRF